MYEPRGNEGYNSLQEMPLPGSISGIESESASSVTGELDWTSGFCCPRGPCRGQAQIPKCQPAWFSHQESEGTARATRWITYHRAEQAWQHVIHPFPSRSKGCFPHVPRGNVTRVGHQNTHDQSQGQGGEREPSLPGSGKAGESPEGVRWVEEWTESSMCWTAGSSGESGSR